MSNLFMDLAGRAGEHQEWTGGWGGPSWILFPLIWIILVGTVIWLLARRGGPGRGNSYDRPAEILATRFARGEIDVEEYRRLLDEIRGTS